MTVPDFSVINASTDLTTVIGALMTVALVVAVAVLVVSAVTWAIATGAGAWQVASRARVGVLVALGGAVLAGAVVAWSTWLLHLDLGGDQRNVTTIEAAAPGGIPC